MQKKENNLTCCTWSTFQSFVPNLSWQNGRPYTASRAMQERAPVATVRNARVASRWRGRALPLYV